MLRIFGCLVLHQIVPLVTAASSKVDVVASLRSANAWQVEIAAQLMATQCEQGQDESTRDELCERPTRMRGPWQHWWRRWRRTGPTPVPKNNCAGPSRNKPRQTVPTGYEKPLSDALSVVLVRAVSGCN